MFIVPTNRKFKTQTQSSPGKPIISGSASKAELQAAAQRYGWTRRELSVKDIQEMSSGENRYHEICNPDLYEAAFQRHAKKDANEREIEKSAVQRMFADRATPEETAAAVKETQKFAERFPQGQFATMPENRKKLIAWLKENNRAITYTNLVEAFETLAIAGDLVLSPNVISVGSEVEVTGEALRKYPRLHKLLAPQKRPNIADTQSADEFKASHPELADRRTPPLIQARQQRDANTVAFFKETEAATASTRDGSANVVDYGAQQRVPVEPEKYSLKQKIRSMSAEEFAQRVKDDPTFAAAIDRASDGNK